ncbi:MAG: hypothetical protein M2R45_04023 [Verrucomicrobia subdivision 3 bacterium]|nr:hypothetical protein [Limisphaerales bacterium]MCS1416226.1 hypothetical protein [Limisphaerales bacterium]
MQLTRQLALFLGNEPGALARMCRALADAKINLSALSVGDTVDHCVVRVVTSDWQQTKRVFEEHNAVVVETEVLMIEGSNHPGSLAAIAEKLAVAKINIDYAYFATGPDAKKGLLILRTSNSRKAMKVLNS